MVDMYPFRDIDVTLNGYNALCVYVNIYRFLRIFLHLL